MFDIDGFMYRWSELPAQQKPRALTANQQRVKSIKAKERALKMQKK